MMGQGMALWNGSGRGRQKQVWRYPTEAEVRWQFWCAVQEGAKGFYYFTYAGWRQRRDSGEYMTGLRDGQGKETVQYRQAADLGGLLKCLAPVLRKLRPALPHEEVVYWENTPVSARTHLHHERGQTFVIVVNNDCYNLQRIGLEIGYWPGMLPQEAISPLKKSIL